MKRLDGLWVFEDLGLQSHCLSQKEEEEAFEDDDDGFLFLWGLWK